jgi:branched-chain amino acid transport system permease protein
MTEQTKPFDLASVLRLSLRGGVVVLFVALVKLIEPFAARELVGGVISIGRGMLISLTAAFGFLNASRNHGGRHSRALLAGLLSGLAVGGILALYLFANSKIPLRTTFINASPGLDAELTYGQETLAAGIGLLLVVTATSGVVGGVLHCISSFWRRPILYVVLVIFLMSVLEDRIETGPLGHPGFPTDIRHFMYGSSGLSIPGALVVLVLVGGGIALWGWLGERVKEGYTALPMAAQRGTRIVWWAILGLFLLTLPVTLQKGLTEIAVIIGYFMLMGFGLNIVVGFAGLLDLGYVAFFAIGAYTTALLTSQGPIGIANWSFWAALPVAVGASVAAGVLLGVPVLRMRGDYLAIVTLGFGEIIKILALSDLLKPVIGGAQGILTIPKPPNPAANVPIIGGPETLKGPEQLYFLILLGLIIAIFISIRVKDSRMGRAWMAMREDEDVAEAMGIELVRYKLLAFAIGAALSGMAGAIFATKIGSIFPHSFQLLISINVLALIIVGGLASLPGVIVGAIILVGLPELLREFQELRLLLFGALLVVMMLLQPEGFMPEAERKRELHAHESMAPLAGTD